MKTFLLLSLWLSAVTYASEPYTWRTYRDIRATKPDTDTARVKVWNIKKNRVIRVNLVEFRGEVPLHKHPDAEHSLLVLDGSVKVLIGGDTFIAGKGDFISVPAGVPHKYWPVGREVLLVSMDAPYYDPSKTVPLE